ncbi:MAG: Mth938-like domain-containing protein [Pseudomonadota bacterium]
MRMNEVSFDGRLPIEGYGPGFFRLGGEVWEGPLLLLPGGPARWQAGEVSPILAARDALDFLLLGTGAEIAHAPAAFRAEIEGAGLGLEVMATPPAARTYNVLLSEGRRMAAALLPV